MADDKTKGMAENLKGRAKEAAGALTGNKKMEAEGAAQRAKGAAQKKVGEIEEDLEEEREEEERKAREED
jgi:uncharacterized protein YjbJ (UPF0337 family)